ncbi:protein translocase subunit SecF [Moraxella sp. ZY210820]|uniref:protein translocase subunit SecF n=1 Tax=unclassified Moraxella TaxID=2685852 RepID=UPI0027300775|nr:protein translocase subunit SecF [Moraxella sp. ZY210820]WLF84426.1 protein translocase subunit SecF [Moraxella sp. ZY210820]
MSEQLPTTNTQDTYQLANGGRVIDFMKIALPMAIISIVLTIASIVFISTKGINLGLDFTGGVSAELNYTQAVDNQQIVEKLTQAGFKDVQVRSLGSNSDLMIQMPEQPHIKADELGNAIKQAVQMEANEVTVAKVDSVGSQVGKELYVRSAGAVGLALLLMLIYITIRFELKLAIGAVLSLFHDIIITLGIFSMMGWPFDLTVLAAILSIIGFSLNDNIVVSDRIRENFRKIREVSSREVINIALTETLRRTIHTSMTLLLVVVAMLIMGGDGLRWFSIAMCIGVFVGTYSSIYIGTSFALWRNISAQDFIVKVKPEFDDEEP